MAFENLPGIFDFKVDGNLGQFPVNANPVVLVIGTADRGPSDAVISATSVNGAAKTFGKGGTLTRGLYETAASGALNVKMFRIGATSARLTLVGGGITIETVAKDDSAGTDYKLYWNDTSDRLIVYRSSDNEIVYDNNPTYPSLAIDLGEVYVSGTVSGNPGSIPAAGTVPITLAAAHGISSAQYTAGTDGTSPSRMKLWENLYKAYILLEDSDLDIIVPMGVFLDDKNTQDMTTAQVSTFNTSAPWAASGNTYPTAGSVFDGLGKVYVQEYQGQHYFWWDLNRDGTADLWPVSVGSSSATTNASGTALTVADFHETNFAYELARFCFDKSENNDEVVGVIGVKPPISFSLSDVSNWVGAAPVTATDEPTGNTVVATNGTGLLGNKFTAGRKGSLGSGLPSFTVDGLDGLAGGGFIAKETQWIDGGTELKDANDKLVDLGKYISLVGAQAILSNSVQDNAYVATGSAAYAGFVSSLAPNSAPMNKVIPAVGLPFRMGLSKLDALAGAGYVMFQTKPKGIVVSDSPTAARSVSDYTRLTTVRIVKATLDAIRAVAEPFLGEPITGARLAALETAIEQVLAKLTKAQFLQRYQYKVTSTPADQVLGKAKVDLILVPAFELRQITVSVSLAAQ